MPDDFEPCSASQSGVFSRFFVQKSEYFLPNFYWQIYRVFIFHYYFLVRFIYDNNVALRLFDFALSAITLFLSQKFFLKHIWLLYLILNGNKTFLSDTKAVEGLSEWPKVHFHIRLKPSNFFQSLNHVDINLKPRFLIKSGYYIVPASLVTSVHGGVWWRESARKRF